jgi:uncharacterized linocin/CFP29 family protein
MNHLHRSLAPVSTAAWAEIENEARDMLSTALAGRKLVDVVGPLGWGSSAVSLGRAHPSQAKLAKGAGVRVREVRPLVEIRVPFEVAREELDAICRGASAPDLGAVSEAAKTAALAEDAFIFHGLADVGSPGLVADAEDRVMMGKDFDYQVYPDRVVAALAKLRLKGIEGPYAVALGPRCYEGVTSTTHAGGYPVLDHLRSFVDGPLIWAPPSTAAWS